MPNPRGGDVIVRSQAGAPAAASFVILDPVSQKLLSGPHPSLSEAVDAAHGLIQSDGRIFWQQHVDERGRPIGPPTLMPWLPR